MYMFLSVLFCCVKGLFWVVTKCFCLFR